MICWRSSFCRAERHVGDGHFLQIGHVLFAYFSASLIWENRRRRPARCLAAATSGSSNTLIVTASPASISAGADQRLALAADFHQLAQFAKVPGRVARVARGRFVFTVLIAAALSPQALAPFFDLNLP